MRGEPVPERLKPTTHSELFPLMLASSCALGDRLTDTYVRSDGRAELREKVSGHLVGTLLVHATASISKSRNNAVRDVSDNTPANDLLPPCAPIWGGRRRAPLKHATRWASMAAMVDAPLTAHVVVRESIPASSRRTSCPNLPGAKAKFSAQPSQRVQLCLAGRGGVFNNYNRWHSHDRFFACYQRKHLKTRPPTLC